MSGQTICTPEITAKLADLLSSGCTVKDTCDMVGIGVSTYYQWRDKSRSGDPNYAGFAEAMRAAVGRGRCAKVKLIEAAGLKDWKAVAWLLERGDPEHWGPQSKLKQELSGPNKGPVQLQSATVEAAKIAEATALLASLINASTPCGTVDSALLPAPADGDTDGIPADG